MSQRADPVINAIMAGKSREEMKKMGLDMSKVPLEKSQLRKLPWLTLGKKIENPREETKTEPKPSTQVNDESSVYHAQDGFGGYVSTYNDGYSTQPAPVAQSQSNPSIVAIAALGVAAVVVYFVINKSGKKDKKRKAS